MRRLIISIFVFLSIYIHSYEYTLSICAIFHDEAPYMKEWIDYHRKVGVEHFWLYNNNSTDEYQQVLKPYIENGVVELIEWPSKSEMRENDFVKDVQAASYNDAIKRTILITKWLAFIDMDEFIVPKCDDNVALILETEFQNCCGVKINWQCFGTSHIEHCPNNLMLPYLVMKMKSSHPWNSFIKSIVKPELVGKFFNSHDCVYINDKKAVDTHGNAQKSNKMRTSKIFLDVLQINHYWTRDNWYFENKKLARYKKWKAQEKDLRHRASMMNEEYDNYIFKFI